MDLTEENLGRRMKSREINWKHYSVLSAEMRTFSKDIGTTVLRKIFGPRRDEVTGEWRRLHN